MIKLYVQGHGATTPLSEIIHAVTGESVSLTDCREDAKVISILNGDKITTIFGEKKLENTVLKSSVRNEKQIVGDAAKLGFYKLAGKELPWGILQASARTNLP